jgi:hypothetical protein
MLKKDAMIWSLCLKEQVYLVLGLIEPTLSGKELSWVGKNISIKTEG